MSCQRITWLSIFWLAAITWGAAARRPRITSWWSYGTGYGRIPSPKKTPRPCIRLAQEGVFFANHHASYPSSTEVNGAAIATGAYPDHSGIIGNREYRPDLKKSGEIKTEDFRLVARSDRLHGGKYLGVHTIAETLQAAGVETAVAGTKPVVFVSGSGDQSYFQIGAPFQQCFCRQRRSTNCVGKNSDRPRTVSADPISQRSSGRMDHSGANRVAVEGASPMLFAPVVE